jgi:hypothetical protein
MDKSIKDINVREFLKKISKSEMPSDFRCIKSMIKRNGVFRVQLVVCGYSQVPVLNFNEIFATGLNDVILRIISNRKYPDTTPNYGSIRGRIFFSTHGSIIYLWVISFTHWCLNGFQFLSKKITKRLSNLVMMLWKCLILPQDPNERYIST